MKRMLMAAVAALALAGAASAQLTCNTFGSMQTCTGPNGYSSTQNTFGDMTTGNDSFGNSWTTNRFGDMTTTNIQPGFGHRFNNGW